MKPALSQEFDFWLDIRELADKRLRELDSAIVADMHSDQVHDLLTTATLPPCPTPRRPIAGNSITEYSMSTTPEDLDRTLAGDSEHKINDDGLSDEAREFFEILQSRSTRQAREITSSLLAAIEALHPSARDAVAHSALSFAVNRLADMHGGIFVQGRVVAILDAKFDG